MNPTDQLSPHFRLHEFTDSDIAARYGIDNTPALADIESLRYLCAETLEPLRAIVGPITITSGYRSERVNALANGNPKSQHMRGEAADIRVPGMTPQQLQDVIRKHGIRIDQCIREFDQWVHVSLSVCGPQRGQFLIATLRDGDVHYTDAFP